DAHRHDDVEERRLNFYNSRAHLVDEIEKDFVLGQRAQRRHEKLRIKRNGKLASLVGGRERFLRFTDLRGVGSDVDVVLAESQFDGVRFVAGQKRNAPQRVQKHFALQFYSLLRFGWNDLLVVWIFAFD